MHRLLIAKNSLCISPDRPQRVRPMNPMIEEPSPPTRNSRPCRSPRQRGPRRHGLTGDPPPRARARGGLGLAAAAYVGVDYARRHLPPAWWRWHGRLQPALWGALALAAAARAPFYRRWDAELRAAPRFLAAMALMLAAFLCEAISVRFVSTVLGLQWHRSVPSSSRPQRNQRGFLFLGGFG